MSEQKYYVPFQLNANHTRRDIRRGNAAEEVEENELQKGFPNLERFKEKEIEKRFWSREGEIMARRRREGSEICGKEEDTIQYLEGR